MNKPDMAQPAINAQLIQTSRMLTKVSGVEWRLDDTNGQALICDAWAQNAPKVTQFLYANNICRLGDVEATWMPESMARPAHSSGSIAFSSINMENLLEASRRVLGGYLAQGNS